MQVPFRCLLKDISLFPVVLRNLSLHLFSSDSPKYEYSLLSQGRICCIDAFCLSLKG